MLSCPLTSLRVLSCWEWIGYGKSSDFSVCLLPYYIQLHRLWYISIWLSNSVLDPEWKLFFVLRHHRCSPLMLYIGSTSKPLCCQTQFYLHCMSAKVWHATIFTVLILRLKTSLMCCLEAVELRVCLLSQHLHFIWALRDGVTHLTVPSRYPLLPPKYAQYHQRHTAMVINIRCCLSNFQVARPHAVCCIKENIHLKVDFCEHSGGWNRGGVCWFKSV